jgi:hypothetical protein
MPIKTRRLPIAIRIASAARGALLVLFSTLAASGQTPAGRGSDPVTYPKLPGAVTKVPQEISSKLPFDFARFFDAPPPDANAAPLYLDAFFEFDSTIEACFPEGPDRVRRRDAALERTKRYRDLSDRFVKNPKSVSEAEIDDLIKSYDTGLRKLALAQRREHCVFECGLVSTSIYPHIQAARQVARILAVQCQRSVERRDITAAVRNVNTALRLVRDLRLRGPALTQLAADAITNLVSHSMVRSILASRALRTEQCDRLLDILSRHDLRMPDSYREGLRASCLRAHLILREITQSQRELRASLDVKAAESVVGKLVAMSLIPATSARAAGASLDWDKQIAAASAAEIARRDRVIDDYFGALLALDNIPYSVRLERIRARNLPAGTDPLSLALESVIEPEQLANVAQSAARTIATLRASECLIALRISQLSHRQSPSSLARVFLGSTVRKVPIDPYDGKPFKMVLIDRKPVVYSVGKDGKNDGGLVDSRNDIQAGDLLYELPPVEDRPAMRGI